MKKFLLFLCAVTLIFGMVGSANATALLVQTNDIWDYDYNTAQPYDALNQSGISYDQISHSEFNSWNLSNYCFLYLVGSDGDTSYFDNFVGMEKVEDYVNAGGLALIHYADWYGDRSDIAPNGVDVTGSTTDSATISPSFVNDPLFANVTDDSLDNWNHTAHGYLVNLPAGADILITDDNGNPLYARYQYGTGEVWVTTMTLEWGGQIRIYCSMKLH